MAHQHARAVAGAVLTAALLTGCDLLGGTDREVDDWSYDEDSDRYYRPGQVTHSPDLVDEHVPVLEDVAAVTIAEGRFTDPAEREPIPAPDDYWWQAVIELEPTQVDELLTATAAAGASDHGGAASADPVPEEDVLTTLVPSLEGEVQDCPGGRVDVTSALARDSGTNISDAGDLLDLAVVCAGGTQLITSARDM
ncbi:hypothetical protein GCM10028787_24700 [Brachybacterium horti]